MKLTDISEATWWDRLTGQDSDSEEAKPNERGEIEYTPQKKVERSVQHSGRSGDKTAVRKRATTKKPEAAPTEEPKKRTAKIPSPEELAQELRSLIKKFPDAKRTILGIVNREYTAKKQAKLSEVFNAILEAEKPTPTVPKRTLDRIQRIVSMMSFEQLRQVILKV